MTNSFSIQMIIQCQPSTVLEALLKTEDNEAWWSATTCFQPQHSFLSWCWRTDAGHYSHITHATVQQFEPGLLPDLKSIWQNDWDKKYPIGPVNQLIECTPKRVPPCSPLNIAGSTIYIRGRSLSTG